MVLDEAFVQKCREAFATFDTDGSGSIDRFEMKLLLEAIGENPTDEELFRFMNEIDEDGTGQIEFPEFLRAFEKQRNTESEYDDPQDTLDAWIALGGNPDKTGCVDNDKLIKIVKEDFAMTLDVAALLKELDKNADGKVDFQEFAALFQ
uniref:Calmodulin n=1 Tax=Chromera velia CCMP2878 TaxID=1169474 RepID=A0A0G4GIY9_9ALVE|mmetsp:Transcript_15313/g.31043  ORF Transcript_15313/g.31043 Transcript_15313/m.31043 type:complete len:149 (-) Transcript_15313:216-662(-)|eukprot:Cvel_22101.t1-p1 / transcript=Cvel_22101.t1 / gene=Cvel_22101 / organism=Chromera_velia_CCMP2878 / gene_product=Dynein 18 kDa light chain, flagellar outer arm, putative / transcript_product=Dynein 18 kDa light chain, flagellar outer arm, putative / location=Cvel_scaffold2139:27521-30489(+) / protein_length=148 / sequence_SO=supercontig / SO=protein_coding / is_pseudo=false